MKLFDSHNHIQDERLFPVLGKVMDRARVAGVERMAIKGCCEADWTRVAEIINKYPDVHLAFGLHPWFVSGRSKQCFQTLEKLPATSP